MAAIFSPSIKRSASNVSLAVTSVPFSMSVRMLCSYGFFKKVDKATQTPMAIPSRIPAWIMAAA